MKSVSKKEVEDFLKHPKLWNKTFGQRIENPETWRLPESKPFHYLYACTDDGSLAAVCVFEELNAVTIDVHICVHPNLQVMKSLYFAEHFRHFLANASNYETLVTSFPEECRYVEKFVKKLGFKPCGEIPNGTKYNNKIQTLKLYSRSVK